MIGLVYKDFFVMRKQLSYYLFFIALYAVLTVAGVFQSSILPALVVVLSMMIPMSSMAYDDQARWGKFAAATPAGRAGVVTAKYLFSLLCLLVSAVLVGVLTAVLGLLHLMEVDLAELGFTLLACMGAALILNAVILPLLIKFGSEKSRIISVILFLVVFGGIFALGAMFRQSQFPAPPAWLLSALPVAIGIVAIGGFVLSYCIARSIFEKKEL